MGLPPPIDSYAALDFGARRFEMRYASGFCSPLISPGSRMMSVFGYGIGIRFGLGQFKYQVSIYLVDRFALSIKHETHTYKPTNPHAPGSAKRL